MEPKNNSINCAGANRSLDRKNIIFVAVRGSMFVAVANLVLLLMVSLVWAITEASSWLPGFSLPEFAKTIADSVFGAMFWFTIVFLFASFFALLVASPILWVLEVVRLNRWFVTIPLGGIAGYFVYAYVFGEEFPSLWVGPYFALNGAVVAAIGWRGLRRR